MAKKSDPRKDPALMDDSNFDDDMLSGLDFDDSDLDNFSFDMEGEDSDKNRSPVEKSESFTTVLSSAGKSAAGGVAAGIASRIKHTLPDVGDLADGAVNVASEVSRLRDDVVNGVTPIINQTKTAARQLLPLAKDLIPKSIYDTVLDKLKTEDNVRDDGINKTAQRNQSMQSDLDSIFAAQQAQHEEERKEQAVQKTIDDRLTQSRHYELASLTSDIRNQAMFQTKFIRSTLTAYLRKDLEIKYRRLYLAEDTLEALRITSQMLEKKLDQIRHNTALPEFQKITLGELARSKITNAIGEKFIGGLGRQVSTYVEGIRDKLKENYIDPAKDMLGTVSDGLTLLAETMTGDMSFGPQPSVKKSLAGWIGKTAGSALGFMGGRKLLAKLPPEALRTVNNFAKAGPVGLIMMLDRIKNGELDFQGADTLSSILENILPDLDKGAGTFRNENYDKLDQAGVITRRFTTAVEQVIPSFLAKQTAYLAKLAGDKVNASDELVFDYMTNKLVNTSTLRKRILTDAFGDANRKTNILHGIDENIRTSVKDKSDREEALKQYEVNSRDLTLAINNLANSKNFPGMFTKQLLADITAQAESETLLTDRSYCKVMFRGIKNPGLTASVFKSLMMDKNGRWDHGALQNVAVHIVQLMTSNADRHRRALYDAVVRDNINANVLTGVIDVGEDGKYHVNQKYYEENYDTVDQENINTYSGLSDYDEFGNRIKEETGLERNLKALKKFTSNRTSNLISSTDKALSRAANKLGLTEEYENLRKQIIDIREWCRKRKYDIFKLGNDAKNVVAKKIWEWMGTSKDETVLAVRQLIFTNKGTIRKEIDWKHLNAIAVRSAHAIDTLRRIHTSNNPVYWVLDKLLPKSLVAVAEMSDEELESVIAKQLEEGASDSDTTTEDTSPDTVTDTEENTSEDKAIVQSASEAASKQLKIKASKRNRKKSRKSKPHKYATGGTVMDDGSPLGTRANQTLDGEVIGRVTKPSLIMDGNALVGERGPETVVPLNRSPEAYKAYLQAKAYHEGKAYADGGTVGDGGDKISVEDDSLKGQFDRFQKSIGNFYNRTVEQAKQKFNESTNGTGDIKELLNHKDIKRSRDSINSTIEDAKKWYNRKRDELASDLKNKDTKLGKASGWFEDTYNKLNEEDSKSKKRVTFSDLLKEVQDRYHQNQAAETNNAENKSKQTKKSLWEQLKEDYKQSEEQYKAKRDAESKKKDKDNKEADTDKSKKKKSWKLFDSDSGDAISPDNIDTEIFGKFKFNPKMSPEEVGQRQLSVLTNILKLMIVGIPTISVTDFIKATGGKIRDAAGAVVKYTTGAVKTAAGGLLHYAWELPKALGGTVWDASKFVLGGAVNTIKAGGKAVFGVAKDHMPGALTSAALFPFQIVHAVFNPYVDVYYKGDTRDPKQPLVTANEIKHHAVVDERGKPPKDSYHIRGPLWYADSDVVAPEKRGSIAITVEQYDSGLVDVHGKPLNRLANLVGSGIGRLGRGIGGLFGGGASFIWTAAGWTKDRVVDTFRYLTKKKNPYIDVYVPDDDGKIDRGNPRLTGENIKLGRYFYADGSVVKSAYGIDQPVMDKDGKTTLITEEDIKNGLYDIEGRKLTAFAGRSILGKLTLGAAGLAIKGVSWAGKKAWGLAKNVGGFIRDKVKGGWEGLKSAGSGLLNKIRRGYVKTKTAVSKLRSLNRKDLEEVVGDRLVKIYELLLQRLPEGETKTTGDSNNDGVRDGSYEERQIQKAEADGLDINLGGRRNRKRNKKSKGSWVARKAGQKIASRVGSAIGDSGISQGIRSVLTGGGARMAAGAAGLGSTGAAIAGGTAAAGAGALGATALTASAGTAAAGTAAAGTAVAGTAAAGGAAAAAGAAGLGTVLVAGAVVVGAAVVLGLIGYGLYRLFKDDSRIIKFRDQRCKAYGVDPSNKDMVDAIKNLEDAEFEVYSGEEKTITNDKLEEIAEDMNFIDTGMFFGMSDKEIKDRMEFFANWYARRFKPIYTAYAKKIQYYTGADLDDEPDVDDLEDKDVDYAYKRLDEDYKAILSDKDILKLVPTADAYKKLQAELSDPSKDKNKDTKDTATGIATQELDKRRAGNTKTDSKVSDTSTTTTSTTSKKKEYNPTNGFKPTTEKDITDAIAEKKESSLFEKYISSISFATPLFGAKFAYDMALNSADSFTVACNNMRYTAYGIDPKNSDQVKAIERLEEATRQVYDGEIEEIQPFEWSRALELFGLATISLNPFKEGLSKLEFNKRKKYLHTWYEKRFRPIFALYMDRVRANSDEEPGDEILASDIHEDAREDTLKYLETWFKKILSTKVDNVPIGYFAPSLDAYNAFIEMTEGKANDDYDTSTTSSSSYDTKNIKDDKSKDEILDAAKRQQSPTQLSTSSKSNKSATSNFNNVLEKQEADAEKQNQGAAITKNEREILKQVDARKNRIGKDYSNDIVDNKSMSFEDRVRYLRYNYYGVDPKNANHCRMIDYLETHTLSAYDGAEKPLDDKGLLSSAQLGKFIISIPEMYLRGADLGNAKRRLEYFKNWYHNRFKPIFCLYAERVRANTNGVPGDDLDPEDIPTDVQESTIQLLNVWFNKVLNATHAGDLAPTDEAYNAYLNKANAPEEDSEHENTSATAETDGADNAPSLDLEQKKQELENVLSSYEARRKRLQQAVQQGNTDAVKPNPVQQQQQRQIDSLRKQIASARDNVIQTTINRQTNVAQTKPNTDEDGGTIRADGFTESNTTGTGAEAATTVPSMQQNGIKTLTGDSGGTAPQIDMAKLNASAAKIPDGGVGDLGSYVKQFESGPSGSSAIGYDGTGGTSYGMYQIASKTGTFAKFLKFTAEKGGEFGKQLVSIFSKVGNPNTGSRKGAGPTAWKQLAAVQNGTALHKLEAGFIRKTHYDAALRNIKDPQARQLIEQDRGLQEALWSTSVQHGAGDGSNGASGIFNSTFKPGITAADWLKAIYAKRGTQFGKSSAKTRKSVLDRFMRELPIVLGLSNSSANAQTTDTQSTTGAGNNTTGTEFASEGVATTSGGAGTGDIGSDITTTPGAGNGSDAVSAPVDIPSSGAIDTNALKVQSGVDFSNLSPILKQRFSQMAKAYLEKFGQKITVTSGKRSLEAQAQLYKKYGPGRAAKPNPLSPHISGLALDANSADMNKADSAGLLAEFGLWRPLKNGLGGTRPEAWHVEVAGSRDPKSKRITQETLNAINAQVNVNAGEEPKIGDAASTDTSASGDDAKSLSDQQAESKTDQALANTAPTSDTVGTPGSSVAGSGTSPSAVSLEATSSASTAVQSSLTQKFAEQPSATTQANDTSSTTIADTSPTTSIATNDTNASSAVTAGTAAPQISTTTTGPEVSTESPGTTNKIGTDISADAQLQELKLIGQLLANIREDFRGYFGKDNTKSASSQESNPAKPVTTDTANSETQSTVDAITQAITQALGADSPFMTTLTQALSGLTQNAAPAATARKRVDNVSVQHPINMRKSNNYRTDYA